MRGRAAGRRDNGTTLVELLVVMVVMGILGTVLVTWYVATERSSTGYTGRITDLAQAQVAVSRFSKDARMAIRPAADVAAVDPASGPTSVRFYVNRTTGAPLLVRYLVEPDGTGGTRLVREATAPSGSGPWTWPATSTVRQPLVAGLGPAGTMELRYFSRAEAGLPGCEPGVTAGCATPRATPPTTGSLDDVGAIEIVLKLRSKPQLTAATELRSRVRVVNAGQTFAL